MTVSIKTFLFPFISCRFRLSLHYTYLDKAISCPTNSLNSRIPDKPRVDTLDSPGSNEPNSRVDFSLTVGSDEADGVSSDGGAEYLSATDGVEVRNSFDCDGSDIDFYVSYIRY